MANLTCDGTPFGACAIRVVKLDPTSGIPIPGAGNVYVTHALISTTFTRQTTEGARDVQKNGCGEECVVVQHPDSNDGLAIDLVLCTEDAELIAMLTGATLLVDGADIVGYVDPPIGETDQAGVGIEVWAKNWEGSHQHLTYPYRRYGIPRTTWVLGDQTLQDGISVIPVRGKGYENPGFHDGPGNDWPVRQTSGDPAFTDGIIGEMLDVDIPDEVCGAQSLTAS